MYVRYPFLDFLFMYTRIAPAKFQILIFVSIVLQVNLSYNNSANVVMHAYIPCG
jgi:hypothetical protein